MVLTRRHQYNLKDQDAVEMTVSKQNEKTQGRISEQEDELTSKLKTLYEDIRSTPSYSAKIEAFLRSNELHSKGTPSLSFF